MIAKHSTRLSQVHEAAAGPEEDLEERTAARDYPELGSILTDRPDPGGIITVIGSRTAAAYGTEDDTRGHQYNGGPGDEGLYWAEPGEQAWQEQHAGPQEDAPPPPWASPVMARLAELEEAAGLFGIMHHATTINGTQVDGHGDAPEHGTIPRAEDPEGYDEKSTEGIADPAWAEPVNPADKKKYDGANTAMYPENVSAGGGPGLSIGPVTAMEVPEILAHLRDEHGFRWGWQGRPDAAEHYHALDHRDNQGDIEHPHVHEDGLDDNPGWERSFDASGTHGFTAVRIGADTGPVSGDRMETHLLLDHGYTEHDLRDARGSHASGELSEWGRSREALRHSHLADHAAEHFLHWESHPHGPLTSGRRDDGGPQAPRASLADVQDANGARARWEAHHPREDSGGEIGLRPDRMPEGAADYRAHEGPIDPVFGSRVPWTGAERGSLHSWHPEETDPQQTPVWGDFVNSSEWRDHATGGDSPAEQAEAEEKITAQASSGEEWEDHLRGQHGWGDAQFEHNRSRGNRLDDMHAALHDAGLGSHSHDGTFSRGEPSAEGAAREKSLSNMFGRPYPAPDPKIHPPTQPARGGFSTGDPLSGVFGSEPVPGPSDPERWRTEDPARFRRMMSALNVHVRIDGKPVAHEHDDPDNSLDSDDAAPLDNDSDNDPDNPVDKNGPDIENGQVSGTGLPDSDPDSAVGRNGPGQPGDDPDWPLAGAATNETGRAYTQGRDDGKVKRGGQHVAAFIAAAGSAAFRFEFTAAWQDVMAKAKRIRAEGHVRITHASPGMVIGEVRGDHDTYESGIQRPVGRRQSIQHWACGCPWASFHQDKSAGTRYAGRPCSHVMALQFEAQSRGMFGRDVSAVPEPPSWAPSTLVVKSYPPFEGEPHRGRWAEEWRAPVTVPARTGMLRGGSGAAPGLPGDSPAREATAALLRSGELPEEVSALRALAGLGPVTADQANAPWGSDNTVSHPPQKPYGATSPPDHDMDPGSYGPLAGPDPANWGGIDGGSVMQMPLSNTASRHVPCSGCGDSAEIESDNSGWCRNCGPVAVTQFRGMPPGRTAHPVVHGIDQEDIDPGFSSEDDEFFGDHGIEASLRTAAHPMPGDVTWPAQEGWQQEDQGTFPYADHANTAGPSTAMNPRDPNGIRMEESANDPRHPWPSPYRTGIPSHEWLSDHLAFEHAGDGYGRRHERAAMGMTAEELNHIHNEIHLHAEDDPDPYDEFTNHPHDGPIDPVFGSLGELSDEPEPALPSTTGDDLEATAAADGTIGGGSAGDGTGEDAPLDVASLGEFGAAYAPTAMGDQSAAEGLTDGAQVPSPVTQQPGMGSQDDMMAPDDQSIQTIGNQQWSGGGSDSGETAVEPGQPQGSIDDIVASFQRSAAARGYGEGGRPQGDGDIAAAARQFLSKTADVLPKAEADALIREGTGHQARNLDLLDLKGTHYEDGDGEDEDDVMFA